MRSGHQNGGLSQNNDDGEEAPSSQQQRRRRTQQQQQQQVYNPERQQTLTRKERVKLAKIELQLKQEHLEMELIELERRELKKSRRDQARVPPLEVVVPFSSSEDMYYANDDDSFMSPGFHPADRPMPRTVPTLDRWVALPPPKHHIPGFDLDRDTDETIGTVRTTGNVTLDSRGKGFVDDGAGKPAAPPKRISSLSGRIIQVPPPPANQVQQRPSAWAPPSRLLPSGFALAAPQTDDVADLAKSGEGGVCRRDDRGNDDSPSYIPQFRKQEQQRRPLESLTPTTASSETPESHVVSQSGTHLNGVQQYDRRRQGSNAHIPDPPRATPPRERLDPPPTKKAVGFTSVTVRFYERITCENPACLGGPPIGIGWRYEAQKKKPSMKSDRTKRGGGGGAHSGSGGSGSQFSEVRTDGIMDKFWYEVDEFEALRENHRKRGPELVVSREDRIRLILEWGFTQDDIAKQTRKNRISRYEQQQTINRLDAASAVDEAVGTLSELFNRTFRFHGRRGGGGFDGGEPNSESQSALPNPLERQNSEMSLRGMLQLRDIF